MRGRPGRGCPRRLPGCWRSTNHLSVPSARRANLPGGSTPAWPSATRCWSERSKSSFPCSRWSSSAGGMRAGAVRRSAPWGAGASCSRTSATRTTSRHSAAGRRSSARSSASSAPPSSTTCRRGSLRRARYWTTASGSGPATRARHTLLNREGDRGVVHRMPTPLTSRFVHLEVRVDAEDWCAWGAANGIAAEVLFFVQLEPTLLHQFDPQSKEKAFPWVGGGTAGGRARTRARRLRIALARAGHRGPASRSSLGRSNRADRRVVGPERRGPDAVARAP